MTTNTEADNKKTNIDQLIQQDDLLQKLTTILEQTDKTILVDMLKKFAALAASAEQPETPEDFSAHINSKLIAIFYTSHASITGAQPSAAVIEALSNGD